MFFTLGVILKPVAQEITIKDYLVLGVEASEAISERYLQPVSKGLLYGLSSGWYHDARVPEPWKFRFSVAANGSFVPSDAKSFELDITSFENLDVVGGGQRVRIPTVLGSTDSDVTFVATLEGETFTFNAPTGIGLVELNLLPTAFLHVGMGLPWNSEVQFRYFPKLGLGDGSVGVVGLGLKHQINSENGPWQSFPLDLAVMAAYTRLDAEYNLEEGGTVTGSGQRIEGAMNAWLTELLLSTRNTHWNLFGGFGYVFGNSLYELLGNYRIQLSDRAVEFNDPFDVRENVSGLRLTAGGSYTYRRFSVHLSYTLQGFNNLAFGMHYNLY
ncbi:hypothetical protein H7F20_05750 [Robiginitalea sp. SC105]|nr:hypothetical protein [Robiginitalea sp. SC105]